MKHRVLTIGVLIVTASIFAMDSEKDFSFDKFSFDKIDTTTFPYIWKKSISYGDFYHPSKTPNPEPTVQQVQEICAHPLYQSMIKKFKKDGTYDLDALSRLDDICELLVIPASDKFIFFSPAPAEPEVQNEHDKAMALRNCIGVMRFLYYARTHEQLIDQINTMMLER